MREKVGLFYLAIEKTQEGGMAMNTHLSRAQRCIRDKVSQELMDLIAERLKGKEFGYLKIIIQDGHVFAIEESERRHLIGKNKPRPV